MKKIILIALLLSLLIGASGFAQTGWALGAEFQLGWTGGPWANGAALCLKFPGLPIMFGFSAIFGNNPVIGISADWWFFTTNLVGPLGLYIGVGAFILIDTAPHGFVDGGLRIPLGLRVFIVPPVFEIFLEPAFVLHVYPSLPTLGLQAAIGLRFWF